jgi:hypothetical protein
MVCELDVRMVCQWFVSGCELYFRGDYGWLREIEMVADKRFLFLGVRFLGHKTVHR